MNHAAFNAFMQLALGETGMEDVPQVLYLTHHALNTWPQQIYPPNAGPYLVPPLSMRVIPDSRWEALPITSNERELANNIIDEYKSQLVVDNAFLHSFVRSNELFAFWKRPILLSGSHTDAQIEPGLNNRLLTGETVSSFTKRVIGWRNIRAVYGEVSSEGTLHLMLEMYGSVRDGVLYQYMLMLGDGAGGVVQSTITVKDQDAYEVGGALTISAIQIAGPVIRVSIPYSELSGTKTFLISAAIYDYERSLSQTIWQSVRLPER
ncbi:hypothetical protein FACS18948_0620 [Clostridia bacterium]|nr:hypothetical protein FACS18948_0620 [Clostridia bacterium]